MKGPHGPVETVHPFHLPLSYRPQRRQPQQDLAGDPGKPLGLTSEVPRTVPACSAAVAPFRSPYACPPIAVCDSAPDSLARVVLHTARVELGAFPVAWRFRDPGSPRAPAPRKPAGTRFPFRTGLP